MSNSNDYRLPEISIKYTSGTYEKHKINSSQKASEIFRSLFDADTLEYQESFLCIFLNRANETIGWYKAGIGGMSGVFVDPRIIFNIAIQCGASGILASHNHPSGNLTASKEDIMLTVKLIEGGKILDIKLLDHIIITNDGHTSMADEGICVF